MESNIIDLKKLIREYSLNKEVLARHLFPNNKYPVLALNRVVAGKSTLNENQISELSTFSGIPIEVIFSGGWVHRTVGKVHIFEFEDFKAELNTENNMTVLFYRQKPVVKKIIHQGDIVLGEYFEKLNSLTKSIKHAS